MTENTDLPESLNPLNQRGSGGDLNMLRNLKTLDSLDLGDTPTQDVLPDMPVDDPQEVLQQLMDIAIKRLYRLLQDDSPALKEAYDDAKTIFGLLHTLLALDHVEDEVRSAALLAGFYQLSGLLKAAGILN